MTACDHKPTFAVTAAATDATHYVTTCLLCGAAMQVPLLKGGGTVPAPRLILIEGGKS